MPHLLETRRPTPADEKSFNSLIGRNGGLLAFRKFYGSFNFADLIDGHLCSVVAYDPSSPSDLKAFLVLSHSPPQGDTRAFLEWCSLCYNNVSGCTLSNTIFLKFLATDERVEKDAAHTVFEAVFRDMVEVENLMLVVPKNADIYPPRGTSYFFTKLFKSDNGHPPRNDIFETQQVYVCNRKVFVPKLAVRGACVEDYDDLVPIFNQQSEVLTAIYGDFFLAELIEAQDPCNKAVVGISYHNKAVGFMALTSVMDMSLLHKSFNLDKFDNLLTSDPQTGKKTSNCFAITLFCLDHAHTSRATDFLPYAFNQFPDKDYCLLTLPSTSTPFSLLAPFTVVRPKLGSTFSHALYLLHRDTIMASPHLKLTRYSSTSSYMVKQFLDGMDPVNRQALQESLKSSHAHEEHGLEDQPEVVAFIGSVSTEVVGVAVVKSPPPGEWDRLQINFATEAYVKYPDIHRLPQLGVIDAFSLHQSFTAHTPFFLREMMRLYQKRALFYEAGPQEDVPGGVKAFMYPVRPRNTIIIPESKAHVPGLVGEGQTLHAMPINWLTRRKTDVNVRVVVVGGGTCGLSFLEELLFDPACNFTNVTVISPNGLADHGPPSELVKFLIHDDDCPAPPHLISLGLRQRVRVLQTTVINIKREEQVVVLPGNREIPYDHLVLATGLQDGSAARLGTVNYQEGKLELPTNVFCPTRPQLCQDVMKAIQEVKARKGKAIVYGSTMDALVTLQGLLTSGMPPEDILFLSPEPAGGVALLPEEKLDGVVEEILAECKVRVVKGRKIAQIQTRARAVGPPKRPNNPTTNTTEGENKEADNVEGAAGPSPEEEKKEEMIVAVSSVTLGDGGSEQKKTNNSGGGRSKNQASQVPCELLFLCGKRDVDPFLFRAVNDTGLVYDGRLVVNAQLTTADPRILAGGPLAKFSRSFNKGTPHQRYSSKEMGKCLAKVIKDRVTGNSVQIPPLIRPRGYTLTLPGGLIYFHIESPETLEDPDRLKQLVTGFCSPDLRHFGRYSCMTVDSLDKILHFAYLGTDKLQAKQYMPVIGLQGSYLLSAVEKYHSETLDDWVAYLSHSWTGALYLDQFVDFALSLRNLLEADEGAKKVVMSLFQAADSGKDDELLVSLRKKLLGEGSRHLPPDTKKLVEDETLTFLSRYQHSLTAYQLNNGD